VGALKVVPGQPREQLEVEVGEVVEEEQVVVVVDELFLDGAIEAFAVGIHLRGLGEGVPMSEQPIGEGGGEMALELAAVVGEHGFDGEGEHGLNQAEELGGGGAGVTTSGPGPGEVGVQIGAGDEVAAVVLGAQLDAVEGHAMAWSLGAEMLGLAQARLAHWLGLARRPQRPRSRAHLVRGIGDQAADGTRARTRQPVGRGKRRQQQMQLFFAEIRMRAAQAPDLGDQGRRPLPLPALFGRRRPRHQRGHVAALGLQLGPPQIQRAPADFERLTRRRQAMTLPELENRQSFLRIGSNHPPA